MVKYWAFISYSHKDSAIADWLHKKLETYRVPGSLVGTPSREGAVPARIIPIFRDRDELPTSSELGDNLQKCLQQSRYLVVICSPAAAQSRWVEEEVRAFKGWNGRDRIIALIANGVPNASDRAEPEQECFPHSMRFDLDDSKAPVRVEPIAADVRPEGDGRPRAFLKIVAGLLGVGFDDLYQREKRRQKRRRILTGATAIAGVLVLATIYWSFRQEMGNVRKEAGLLTTEFKDVRPKSKEAESRIRTAVQRAEKALDPVEEARQANKPDEEYKSIYQNSGKAVAAVGQEARTADESIFAMELSKPLHARQVTVGAEYFKEMTRRTQEKMKRNEEKVKREIEEANRKR